MKRIFWSFYLLFFATLGHSQGVYPQNYFRSPIDFRILLSATFGELRSDHFHTGIDIKTRGVEGANIYASADAYVSRVRVSAFGTGKTIYLTHPNGYVTVYGHLSKFDDKLADYVKLQQYKQKSFEIDLYPEKDQFKYAKGDLIAYSGNSGSSGGPHLHFEIRDEKTQEPLNPLLFGLEVKDYIRPSIQSVRVYPAGKKPFILDLAGWGENYRLKSGDTIAFPKTFYLGISAVDKQNDTQNSNGVYEVDLFVDSVKVYGNRQERLDFSTGRDINTFIDYAYFMQHNRRYQRSFIGRNNNLKIYTGTRNNGLIQLPDEKIHQISYVVKDANGNTSKLKFHVYASNKNIFNTDLPDTLKKAIFYADKQNVFDSDHLKLSLPMGALYDSLYFHFDILPADKKSFTPIYRVHQNIVPLHKPIYLSIKAEEVPESLKPKTVIASVEGGNYTSYPTKWVGPWATTSIRNFGEFALVVDTIKPQIKWMGLAKNTSLIKGAKISFIIKDELSGIKNYKGFFNDEWVLFEYDAKNDLIFYHVEAERLKSENKLRIEVEDMVGNKRVYERKFNKI